MCSQQAIGVGESELLQPLVNEANIITDEERIVQVWKLYCLTTRCVISE